MNYYCLPFFSIILFIISVIIFLILEGRRIGYSPDTIQERLDIKSKMVEK